jgi:hypothetical protein
MDCSRRLWMRPRLIGESSIPLHVRRRLGECVAHRRVILFFWPIPRPRTIFLSCRCRSPSRAGFCPDARGFPYSQVIAPVSPLPRSGLVHDYFRALAGEKRSSSRSVLSIKIARSCSPSDRSSPMNKQTTPLRRRMIDDMTIRNMSPSTMNGEGERLGASRGQSNVHAASEQFRRGRFQALSSTKYRALN